MGPVPLSATAAAVVFAIGLAFASGSVSLPEFSNLGASEPGVLVVVVGEDAIDDVRRALRPDNVVHDSGSAIAVEGGRVLAADIGAASVPLNFAGWADRPIEIFHVSPRELRPGAGPSADSGEGAVPGSAEHLAELMQKPTLTRGEQMAVLKAMNEGRL